MKSHVLLMRMVLQECGTTCCTSTTRDFNTITRRVEDEGLSFLTIVLPKFCQDFERSLDSGLVAKSSFVGYSKKGYLPRFLSGFTSQVFNTNSGVLLDVPNIDAIRSVRQITLMFGKVNLPCSESRVAAAISQYIECEKQVRVLDALRPSSAYAEFRRMSLVLFGDMFSNVDRDIYEGNIMPKHGPGSTADKLLGNEKWNQTEWTERLEDIFSYTEYLYPNLRYALDEESTPLPICLLEPGSERPVRVVTVPKTLKAPRIIAIEPTCMQFMQQGILDSVLRAHRRDDILREFIGFDNQIPNQDMARQGSSDGSLATLDLSEASDRVSNQLVRELVSVFPHFRMGLDATRSRKADVPGFGVIRLAKYASMGSALCFPIEAFVFTTIVFLGIERALNTSLSRRDLLAFVGKVRIYGDDIVVPVDYVQSVVATLQDFGLVVNVNKSFWTGRFRESCGKEYFDGEDVSIVRVREVLPTTRRHVREIISTVSLRNQFYMAGYWETCRFLDELLERLIPFPMVLPTSPALGRHSFLGYDDTQKLCRYLQKPLVKAYVPTARIPRSHLEGSGALLKYFTLLGDEPSIDEDHLERAGRPLVVDMKLRWVSPT